MARSVKHAPMLSCRHKGHTSPIPLALHTIGGALALAGILLAGCITETDNTPALPAVASCPATDLADPGAVPACLFSEGTISAADRDSASRLFAAAVTQADSFRALGGTVNFDKGARLARSLAVVTGFHARKLFTDSARFHRAMDIVSVALEISHDTTGFVTGKFYPIATPWLTWYAYPGIGAYFQPVTTAQTVAYLLPRPSAPTDSLLEITQHLYAYALWREHNGLRFPVWEYDFTWTSGGITAESPWVSAMAQGLVMSVFAECYRRTSDLHWRDRAYEVLNSFRVNWSDGGVRLDDSTHGYWWEEFHPLVKVWNGSVQALFDVGFLWTVTQDPEVKAMFDRGIESLKYYTPDYDTGTWTIYSRTQGLNSVFYHGFHIALLDVMYSLTSDPWFSALADRWRTYTHLPVSTDRHAQTSPG